MTSPWSIAADIFDPPSDGWVPLPHQVPPDGDWFAWLLMGGRGAGKTATAAHYMHDHVNGPPCLPGVPGGHWPAIIGPTIGDVVTSAVNGPSGLRRWEPDIKLRQVAGGTMVRWPNGTEAKVFGAHSPEDIERLRSGGNRCLAKGSLVLTKRGEVPIETVTRHDEVLTREGWRRVLARWDNGRKKTITMHFNNGRCLTLTPDHKVLVDGSWVEAGTVSIGAKMTPWETSAIQDNTSKSGKQPMGRFQKVMTSIIGTMTRRTTSSRTSSYSRGRNTGLGTPVNVDLTGTPEEAGRASLLSDSRQHRSPASNAGLSSSRSARSGSATKDAPTPTSSSTPKSPSSTTSFDVTTAMASSSPSGSPASPSQGSVLLSAVTEGPEVRVFDLTVDEHHEFYAEGVMVHNCFVWIEELAAMRYMQQAWQHMRYGLRVGPHPHVVISTTPKALTLVKELRKKAIEEKTNPDTGQREVVMTIASTKDNPHLDAGVRRALYEDYAGTRMGRQELDAEILEDVEGAMWNTGMIEADRLHEDWTDRFDRILVGVDPQGKNKADGKNDETGIVACGKIQKFLAHGDYSHLSHGFVLADRSGRFSPKGWAQEAIDLYHELGADGIVAEVNNGGDMVKSNIHAVDATVRVFEVTATRGKARRAAPIVNMYEQHRIHHVGVLPKLEDQMTTWDEFEPDESWSPDRMDAMVWALTKLMKPGSRRSSRDKDRSGGDQRLAGRR